MDDTIISTVTKALTSMLLDEVKLVTGANDEVEALVNKLKSFQAVLDSAEEQQLEVAAVENWLFNIKDASYDMDDVIDEWNTWIQKSQVQNQHHSSGSIQSQLKHKVLSIFRGIYFIMRDFGHRHVVARKIRKIQPRLSSIEVPPQLISTNISERPIGRRTASRVNTQMVKGRDKEEDEVKSMIFNPKSRPHVISLVGMGGIGKTTLAQLIYNDREVITYFEKKIWICVSNPFDEMRIAKAIVESVSGSDSAFNFIELDSVLKKISEALGGRKFLLVLDDVWNEDGDKWKQLEQCLACGLPGSTILITTRKKKVAEVMGCNLERIHMVEPLTLEECWLIISQALDQEDCQRLENMGKEIAVKCKGLPLVATIIRGLLSNKKSEDEWSSVLIKKEWADRLGPFKLSYYDLPLPLKQCFKYCAIFPEDFKIERKRLIGMWIAQGYLKGKKNEDDLEMVGEAYFDDLVARSLLQMSSENKDYYVLHDMVSELARIFTKNECLIKFAKDIELNGRSLYANANVRHLTLMKAKEDSFPMSICGLKKLRSLIIIPGSQGSLAVVELKGIFDHLTCLRTLDLSYCKIEEVPSSINRLVHLRWLDLSRNFMKNLPETLCECYNLQTLNLEVCVYLVKLPEGIKKLINLMYLNVENCCQMEYLPKGIGNLSSLKECTFFFISPNKSKSFSLVELEKLNNLRGRLHIEGLKDVRKVEEAKKAQLMKKKYVTDLSLSFGDHLKDKDDLLEAELLEALEPPSNLKILSIKLYRGKTFPSWMTRLDVLRKLWINDSKNCEELPPFGKLPCLEELYLEYMEVKRVGVEFLGIEKEKDASTSFVSFPKLEILQFWFLKEWKEWDDIDEWVMERINNKTITIMPSLQQLKLYYCTTLKTLPYRLLSSPNTTRLQKMDIVFADPLDQEFVRDKLSHIPRLRFSEGDGEAT